MVTKKYYKEYVLRSFLFYERMNMFYMKEIRYLKMWHLKY